MSRWPVLSHFTKKPLRAIRTIEQAPADPGYLSQFEKPKGLWVSVDGEHDWPAFCHDAGWPMDTRYLITLQEDANILTLSGHDDLDHFTAAYSVMGRLRRPCIFWEEVARRFHGLLITPYCWTQRLNLTWYYGWDCASGCIWHKDAIASFAECRQEAA